MLSNFDLQQFVFGRLTLEAIPYHDPILLGTFIVVAVLGVALLGAVTWFGLWGWLWREWLTSVDHKKIGIMYIILGIIMLLRGFADALMMRPQQAIAVGGGEGYLTAAPLRPDLHRPRHDHDLLRGDAAVVRRDEFVMPLQIGARDVAFPFLNNLSLWLTVGGRRAGHGLAVRR